MFVNLGAVSLVALIAKVPSSTTQLQLPVHCRAGLVPHAPRPGVFTMALLIRNSHCEPPVRVIMPYAVIAANETDIAMAILTSHNHSASNECRTMATTASVDDPGMCHVPC
jgi:hypothetical protein